MPINPFSISPHARNYTVRKHKLLRINASPIPNYRWCAQTTSIPSEACPSRQA